MGRSDPERVVWARPVLQTRCEREPIQSETGWLVGIIRRLQGRPFERSQPAATPLLASSTGWRCMSAISPSSARELLWAGALRASSRSDATLGRAWGTSRLHRVCGRWRGRCSGAASSSTTCVCAPVGSHLDVAADAVGVRRGGGTAACRSRPSWARADLGLRRKPPALTKIEKPGTQHRAPPRVVRGAVARRRAAQGAPRLHRARRLHGARRLARVPAAHGEVGTVLR